MRHQYTTYTVLLTIILAFVAVSHAETLNGTKLYAKHCAKCHNDLQNTVKAGRRVSRIQSAIDTNRGGMAHLKGLSKDEVQAISDALTRLEAPPDSLTGKELYRIYCSSCHKHIDNNNIRSKTSKDVVDSLKAGKCIEVDLKFLRNDDIGKIVNALRPAPAHNSK